jgi:hypothetical protein
LTTDEHGFGKQQHHGYGNGTSKCFVNCNRNGSEQMAYAQSMPHGGVEKASAVAVAASVVLLPFPIRVDPWSTPLQFPLRVSHHRAMSLTAIAA